MSPSAIGANACGIALRAQGQLHAAIAAFERALEAYPNVVELALNLAQTRYEYGDNPGAAAAYQRALQIDANSVAAHLGLYEILQILGDHDDALAHQRSALEQQTLFSAVAPREVRRVLVLCTPGDWQANVPVDFLFDRATTTVHKLYLTGDALPPASALPKYDVVWNTIAESPTARPHLERAAAFVQAQTAPSLNASAQVLGTSRMRLGETLQGVDCVVAPIVEVPRNAILERMQPFHFPIIVRPVGSHAGHGLERIDDERMLPEYAQRIDASEYFISPFINYASHDGLFRKYRIVFVDGTPYPVHLAISPRWMIHYYNAAMAENAWMRDEEASFLESIGNAFNADQIHTLHGIAQAVGLEYFGIDCALERNGRIFVFEADPAMLVHSRDSIELYPYKHRYIPRIYRAVEAMLDARQVADT